MTENKAVLEHELEQTEIKDFLIHSPEEEYRLYVEQEIENVRRFGEVSKVKLYESALQYGLKVLKEL